MDRPFGVTLLALMNLAGAGACVLAAIGGLNAGFVFLITSSGMSGQFGWGTFLLIGGACLLLGLFLLAVGIGLWKLRNRCRLMQIVLLVVLSGLEFFAVLGAARHAALGLAIFRSLILGVEVWILIYLFKPRVREAFGVAPRYAPSPDDS